LEARYAATLQGIGLENIRSRADAQVYDALFEQHSRFKPTLLLRTLFMGTFVESRELPCRVLPVGNRSQVILSVD
jgi:hypothetical protein